MPKTAVYQLRLTPEEKAKLAATARGREVSIAGMIREDYELAVDFTERDDPEPPETIEEVVATFREVRMGPKEVTRLARQKYGHLPLGLAERKVREEMGS